MSEPDERTGDGDWRQPTAPREPVFNLAPVVTAFILGCVLIEALRVFILSDAQDLGLVLRAAFIPARYANEYLLDLYAFTSPVTYSLLHGGWLHVAVNMTWLAAFGSPLAHRVGVTRFVLFWVATSVAAAALHYALHAGDATPLVGASGAISGMMGAAARYGFRVDRRSARPAFGGRVLGIGEALSSRGVLAFLAVWMVVNLVTGVGSVMANAGAPIAWEAHIGGFLAGFLGIRVFDRPLPSIDR